MRRTIHKEIFFCKRYTPPNFIYALIVIDYIVLKPFLLTSRINPIRIPMSLSTSSSSVVSDTLTGGTTPAVETPLTKIFPDAEEEVVTNSSSNNNMMNIPEHEIQLLMEYSSVWLHGHGFSMVPYDRTPGTMMHIPYALLPRKVSTCVRTEYLVRRGGGWNN